MKLFNGSRKFQIFTVHVKLKASFLLNALLSIYPVMFITEALHLVVNIDWSFYSYVRM